MVSTSSIALMLLLVQGGAASPPAAAASVEHANGEASAALPVADEATSERAVHDDEITVTATGVALPLGVVPSAVSVIGGDEILASPAAALDDTLRALPGFTLFRRSGSRTANPTAQGAALRGLGGSATSRALVLADGVPLVDPFGGWVHWGRLPSVALERLEVVRGGVSGLYGTGAVAGVVQLFRRSAGGDGAVVEVQGGGQGTAGAALWSSARGEAWSATATGERFTTRGYVPVAEEERGAVDRPAGSRRSTGELTLQREHGGSRLFARAGALRERRGNGTPLQTNATDLAEAALGADLSRAAGTLELRGWALVEDYEQTFTAVDASRAGERLIRAQEVPSRARGASARWRGALGDRHHLLAGLDGRDVRGESRERAFLASGTTVDSASGGEQEAWGVWLEDVAQLAPRWSVAAALRYDHWRNDERGGRVTARAEALSPRVAVRFQPSPRWGLAAAGYGAFRAPTLNELYRGFRVGDVTTDPNARLGPERLRGGELGADWQSPDGNARLQATAFWMELEDAITNVTIAGGPQGIRRRRENVGRTRSRGLELEASVRLHRDVSVRLAGQHVDAEVVEFDADPSLVGRRVAQVPREQLALTLDWRRGERTASLQARWSGNAFDDDRNALPLGEQTLVHLRLARQLAAGELFVAVENLLDDEHAVGRTPILTVGSPRLVRGGIRWRWGAG